MGTSVQEEPSDALFSWIQSNILLQMTDAEANKVTRQCVQFPEPIKDFSWKQYRQLLKAYPLIKVQILDRVEEIQEITEIKMLAIARAKRVAESGGDADVHFSEYLGKCYTSYFSSYYHSVYPYTTLVQSSGTGKSRLLKQLAAQANRKESQQMKVLYLCALKNLLSTDSYQIAEQVPSQSQ